MKALEFVTKYLEEQNKEYLEESFFKCFREYINEDPIHEESLHGSRWWDNITRVAEVNGKLIGYKWAKATGDGNPTDLGWEFDKDTIHYVEKKTKQVEYYEKVSN